EPIHRPPERPTSLALVVLLPQGPPDRQQPEAGDQTEERSVAHAAARPSSALRSWPARAKRSACGGWPSPRTSRSPCSEKTSEISMTSSSTQPLSPTISRTRRRPSENMSRCTTRSIELATVGTTKRLETFSPASMTNRECRMPGVQRHSAPYCAESWPLGSVFRTGGQRH